MTMNGSTPKLHFGKLVEAEHARRVLRANIPSGVSVEDVVKPAFFTHHTAVIRGGDIIEAACEDGSWMAWLWVAYVSKAEVVVHQLWHTEIKVTDKVKSASHEIKWRGPTAKWSILETGTGKVVEDKIESQPAAHKHLAAHLQSMAR